MYTHFERNEETRCGPAGSLFPRTSIDLEYRKLIDVTLIRAIRCIIRFFRRKSTGKIEYREISRNETYREI